MKNYTIDFEGELCRVEFKVNPYYRQSLEEPAQGGDIEISSFYNITQKCEIELNEKEYAEVCDILFEMLADEEPEYYED
jgi:hypothetical protein